VQVDRRVFVAGKRLWRESAFGFDDDVADLQVQALGGGGKMSSPRTARSSARIGLDIGAPGSTPGRGDQDPPVLIAPLKDEGAVRARS
jgi:hypothetical protein